MATIYTCELLEIYWALDYDFDQEATVHTINDGSTIGEEPSSVDSVTDHEKLPIVDDADGIPVGQSPEENAGLCKVKITN